MSAATNLNIESKIFCINFNQDYSCFSVGDSKGFRIFNCDPFGKCYEKDDGSINICEMLFSSSLVAVVGAGNSPTSSPRKLNIFNTKRQTVVCELSFPSKILAVLLNRKRLAVCLEQSIHIYDLATMKILHTVETSNNFSGVCAMSSNADNSLLAYPSSETSGKVQIFDLLELRPVCEIAAHEASVSKMAFNFHGNLLATASSKGTIIRVFNTKTGQRVYQFRRGSYPARIHCLNFSLRDDLLAASSDSGTTHIFKLQNTKISEGKQNLSINSIISNPVSILDGDRNFAHLTLPNCGVLTKCAINASSSAVFVIGMDGCFYHYKLDVEIGGQCELLHQHSFKLTDDFNSMSNMSI